MRVRDLLFCVSSKSNVKKKKNRSVSRVLRTNIGFLHVSLHGYCFAQLDRERPPQREMHAEVAEVERCSTEEITMRALEWAIFAFGFGFRAKMAMAAAAASWIVIKWMSFLVTSFLSPANVRKSFHYDHIVSMQPPMKHWRPKTKRKKLTENSNY